MAQDDILKNLMLILFNDEKLKDLMAIPIADRNDLILFRDKYCIADVNASASVDNTIPCRLVLSWLSIQQTRNADVAIRPLNVDIYTQKKRQYDVTNNALDRRQDMVTKRIKQLIHNERISDFLFRSLNLGDLLSGNLDYSRCFILFNVKYIF